MMTDWHGLYSESWKNEIVPSAFSHPAKFSRGLIRKIYAHMIEQGYLAEGDTVLDPFGGVALGALDAMINGCNWVGVELEQKFVDLGNQNIALWNKRYAGRLKRWGEAHLVQGDSRELRAMLGRNGVDCAVSSPPFQDSDNRRDSQKDSTKTKLDGTPRALNRASYGADPRNLGNLKAGDVDVAISSPPFLEAEKRDKYPTQSGNVSDAIPRSYVSGKQGETPGQLSAMKPGDIDAAISSPPYAESIQGKSADATRKRIKEGKYKGKRPDAWTSKGNIVGHSFGDDYGNTPGQLGAMKATGFDASVSNPPYEGCGAQNQGGQQRGGAKHLNDQKGDAYNRDNPDNLGNVNQDTFWTAARTIIEQTHAALKPGGYAAWVVKSFVRNKQIVDFPGQWQQLCEACGFETVEIVRAWLVEDAGTKIDLAGNHHQKTKERKSFFRRLAESKGSPRIDFEQVLIMRQHD